MNIETIKEALKDETTLLNVRAILNGGPGSGNFGHAGIPGEVGGSSGGGSAGRYSSNINRLDKIGDEIENTIRENIAFIKQYETSGDPEIDYAKSKEIDDKEIALRDEFVSITEDIEGMSEDIRDAYESDAPIGKTGDREIDGLISKMYSEFAIASELEDFSNYEKMESQLDKILRTKTKLLEKKLDARVKKLGGYIN